MTKKLYQSIDESFPRQLALLEKLINQGSGSWDLDGVNAVALVIEE